MDKKSENLEENIKRHISVMVEDFRSDVKIISEQYSGLNNKIDLILEDIDELKSDMVDVKKDIKEIKGDIVDMKSELKMKFGKEVAENHEKRIVKLEKSALATG